MFGGFGPAPGPVAADVVQFLKGVIEATANLVPAAKPQSAFFEVLGVAEVEA